MLLVTLHEDEVQTHVSLLSCSKLAWDHFVSQTREVQRCCTAPKRNHLPWSLPPATRSAADSLCVHKILSFMECFPFILLPPKSNQLISSFLCLSFHELNPSPVYAGMASWSPKPLNQDVRFLPWLCVSDVGAMVQQGFSPAAWIASAAPGIRVVLQADHGMSFPCVAWL